jgi:hypothetical protein
MTRRLLASFLLGFGLIVTTPVTTPPLISSALAQDSDLEPFKQIELDRSLAIRALDAYIGLKESVTPEQFDSLFDEGNEEKLVDLVPAFQKILVDNGFADEDRWIEVLQSVVIAYEGLKEGTKEENEKAIEELRSDQNLPPEQRMIPSENNMTVVRELLSDPVNSKKLSQVVEEM